MDLLFALLAGYALGSLPFAYWLGRWRGVTLTSLGTGNPGAANLFRQSSRRLGVMAGALDMAKGASAVLVGRWLGLPSEVALASGAAAVVGHWHSPFLGFRGGAGLATAIGVGLGAAPIASTIGLAVGVATTAIGRNVGRGGGFGWTTYLGVSVALGDRWPLVGGVVGLGLVVLLRTLLLDRRRAA